MKSAKNRAPTAEQYSRGLGVNHGPALDGAAARAPCPLKAQQGCNEVLCSQLPLSPTRDCLAAPLHTLREATTYGNLCSQCSSCSGSEIILLQSSFPLYTEAVGTSQQLFNLALM